MKYLLTVLLISLIAQQSLAQSIKGNVKDQAGNPLIGASVYIDGTTIGDVTDTEGEFSFEYTEDLNALLVISFIGYSTAYIEKPLTDTPYNIVLKEDVDVMNELVVYPSPFSRDEMLKAFKRQFIGERAIQKKCKILNEEVIRFRYNPKSFVLEAFAKERILIKNEYLAYEIHYDLRQFQTQYISLTLSYDDIKSNIFAGTSQYIELDMGKKTLKHREKAFNNSPLSFFRGLSEGELETYNYRLGFKGFLVDHKDFILRDTSSQMTKIIVKPQQGGFNAKDFVARFQILYNGKEQSGISFYTEDFLIDKFGVHSNYDQIIFSGSMAKKKMALSLPANYGM